MLFGTHWFISVVPQVATGKQNCLAAKLPWSSSCHTSTSRSRQDFNYSLTREASGRLLVEGRVERWTIDSAPPPRLSCYWICPLITERQDAVQLPRTHPSLRCNVHHHGRLNALAHCRCAAVGWCTACFARHWHPPVSTRLAWQLHERYRDI